MSPQIALYITLGVIWWFFRKDRRRREGVSSASWLVLAWMVIFASRPISGWFQGGMAATPDSYMEGSPMDAAAFFVLILLGGAVLVRRRVSIGEVVSQNTWVCVFFAYCAISVLWSDYPFVAFKRWFKDFGNVILALVLLTEKEPVQAIRAVFTRCAFLLVLLSVLFVRYYPDLGRSYTGYNKNDRMYVGVATHKNTLGALLLVSCGFLLWDLTSRKVSGSKIKKLGPWFEGIIVLVPAFWLLQIADSATSLLCTFLAIVIYLGSGVGFIKSKLRYLEVYAIVGGITWFLLDSVLGLTQLVVEQGLGRDMTLTTRTDAWDIVLNSGINPLIGAGFKSFWAGDRMATLWQQVGQIVQAHNGYIETYLNGGIFGVLLLVIMLLSGFRKIKSQLVTTGNDLSRIRLTFWIIALIYNFSEAAFNQLSLLWFVTMIVIMEPPKLAAPKSLQLTTRFAPKIPAVSPRFGTAGRMPVAR